MKHFFRYALFIFTIGTLGAQTVQDSQAATQGTVPAIGAAQVIAAEPPVAATAGRSWKASPKSSHETVWTTERFRTNSSGRVETNHSSSVPVGQTIALANPYDLAVGPDRSLYALSRAAGTVTQFGPDGTPLMVSSVLGTTPSGIDVDSLGNVYVALTGNNQVLKLKTVNGLFQIDTTFNSTGRIGKSDGSTGAGNGQFNAPFDVAVAPDGTEIDVSDSGNHRIQRFAQDGGFIASFGSLGSDLGNFNTPKGLSFSKDGLLQIVDSGNNRLIFARDGRSVLLFGQSGTGSGQFQSPVNVTADQSGVYVADTGNNRLQKLVPFIGIAATEDTVKLAFAWSLSTIPGLTPTALSQPSSVAIGSDLVHETVYIADTANNRILKVDVPKIYPDSIWADFKQRLINGDVAGALNDVATDRVPELRKQLLDLGNADLAEMMNAAGPITPVFIDANLAKYRYKRTYQGVDLTFLIGFVKENGQWKIEGF